MLFLSLNACMMQLLFFSPERGIHGSRLDNINEALASLQLTEVGKVYSKFCENMCRI